MNSGALASGPDLFGKEEGMTGEKKEHIRLNLKDSESGEDNSIMIGYTDTSVGLRISQGGSEVELWLSADDTMKLAASIEHGLKQIKK